MKIALTDWYDHRNTGDDHFGTDIGSYRFGHYQRMGSLLVIAVVVPMILR